MSQLKEVTLSTIADGVASELFQHELDIISENIQDPNTNWQGKRSITLTFEFSADENRDEVKVNVNSKSVVAPIKGHSKTVYCGKKNGKNTLYSSDTKQMDIFDDHVTPIMEAK